MSAGGSPASGRRPRSRLAHLRAAGPESMLPVQGMPAAGLNDARTRGYGGWLHRRRRAGRALSAGAEARYDHRLMETIRVALAEDNVLLREGVSRLVSANEEFELVGTAPDLPQLLALVRERQHHGASDGTRAAPHGATLAIQAGAV